MPSTSRSNTIQSTPVLYYVLYGVRSIVLRFIVASCRDDEPVECIPLNLLAICSRRLSMFRGYVAAPSKPYGSDSHRPFINIIFPTDAPSARSCETPLACDNKICPCNHVDDLTCLHA